MNGKTNLGPKKTRSIIHPISCTLEELYNGKTTRIKVTRLRKKEDPNANNKKDDEEKKEVKLEKQ